MKKLTEKQERVLRLIARWIKDEGYPPTLQEMADELGVASKNAVVKMLQALEKKGYIRKSSLARGIQFVESMGLLDKENESSLPVVGAVTAGMPMLAQENIERFVQVPRSLLRGVGRHFLLRVRGDSMRDAGILDGDLVVVNADQNAQAGDIVVALLGQETTVKRLMVKSGIHFLKAENPDYPNIYPETEWTAQGRVVALIREMV